MEDPRSYFVEHDLYDFQRLKEHAEHNFVHVTTEPNLPGLVLLHYAEEAQWEKRWTTFARMCRGLVVDIEHKKILAWPVEKFYNLGEMPETSYDILVNKGSFETSEKLDGSLCILFKEPYTGQFRITTRGSFSSVQGAYATLLLPEVVKTDKWVNDYTLMFELISPKFPIVINYSKKGYKEGLYLIGARNLRSGQLLSYTEVQELAHFDLGVPSVKRYSFTSLDSLIKTAKDLPVLEEGYVLRFNDGRLVKVKGTAYLKAHRFISKLSDKHLLEAVAEGIDNEIIECSPEEYRDDIIDKVAYFKSKYLAVVDGCYQAYSAAIKEIDINNRKEYAWWVNRWIVPHLRSFMFTLYDKKPLNKKRIYQMIGEVEKVSGETRI